MACLNTYHFIINTCVFHPSKKLFTYFQSEPVSSHIKEAIKQRKIHKELHPNRADFTDSKPSIISRVRKQNVQASTDNRYRVLSGKRALELNELDDASNVKSSQKGSEETHNQSSTPAGRELMEESHSVTDNKENSSACSTVSTSSSKLKENPPASSENTNAKEGDSDAKNAHEKFCIFDIEKDCEKPDPFFGVSQVCIYYNIANNHRWLEDYLALILSI